MAVAAMSWNAFSAEQLAGVLSWVVPRQLAALEMLLEASLPGGLPL